MMSQNVISKGKVAYFWWTDAYVDIENRNVKIGTYLKSNDVTCDHLHGPPQLHFI